ncbi:PilW family protein [Dechloromonas sp. ZY10]|uniref:PilW family protein n=1 Tax=Dechloromonas aquae TaxID=2664436 RepID=UPI0035274D38
MSNLSSQRGLTLIELMVGVLIGMLTTVIVFHAFSLNERQKRVTTGTADAQTNGALGLFMLERDLRMAGFGLETDFSAKCNVTYSYYDNGSGAAGPLPGMSAVAPLVITDGGAGSDQIAVVYYADPADNNFSIPSYTTLRSTMPQPSAELNVSSTDGCKEGALAIVQQAGNCMVMEITQVQDSALKIQHNPGGAGTAGDPVYNPNNPYIVANAWPAFAKDAVVRCGFSAPLQRTYRISAAYQLESQDSGSAAAISLAPQIVSLQAQYGISDTAASNKVTAWVDPTGAWAAATLTRALGSRIKAVRVAVVARNSEYEKPEPGQACATTTQAMLDQWSDWAEFASIKTLPDWACYRYKAFETVIPLRNVLWAAF